MEQEYKYFGNKLIIPNPKPVLLKISFWGRIWSAIKSCFRKNKKALTPKMFKDLIDRGEN